VSAPLFTLSAHSLPVSALDFNPCVPGMLLTGSADRHIKLWDIKDNQPALACSRDVGAGKVFTVTCCPDSPYHVAVGGSLGTLSVWNITENAAVRKLFKGRLSTTAPGLIQLEEQPEDSTVNNKSGEEEEEDDDDRMEMEETIEEMKGAAGTQFD
jgi:periodic tryptophan protein 1